MARGSAGAVCDLELAVRDNVEAVAWIARADDDLAARDVDRDQLACDVLLGHHGQRREHRHFAQEGEPRGGGGHVAVDGAELRPRDQRQQRQDRSNDGEGRTWAECADDGGGGDRAHCYCAHHHAPGDAEDAAEDLVGDDALEEREACDVLEAVGGADNREEEDRDREVRLRGDQGDREPPEDERDAEQRRQPFSLERERAEGADQAAGAERGRQVADRAVVGVEDAEDGDHDQDVQAAADESLGAQEEDDQAGSRLAGEFAEPVEHQLPRSGLLRGGLDPALDLDGCDECGCDEHGAGRRREHDAGVGRRDDHTCDQRPAERAEALDRGRGAVRGDQLLGGSRERGQDCLQRGADEGGGDAHDSCEREDEHFAAADKEGGGRAAERAEAGQ